MSSLNDNTLTTANDLGVLSTVREIADTFDSTDRIGYYKFTLPQNCDLSVLYSSGTSNFYISLISDINANGTVEDNEIIYRQSSSNSSFLEPLPAGTYFITEV